MFVLKRGSQVNNEVISYIERHLKKGIAVKKIKSTLLKAGHSSEVVEESFKHLAITKPSIFKRSYLWLVFFVLLAVAGIIFFFSKTPVPSEVQQHFFPSEINFSSMSDTDLLLYAKDSNTTTSCEFITDNYNKGLCLNSIWNSRPCYFKRVIGDNSPC